MSKTFYRLIQGDNRVVLPTLEDNSIDCIVTDPQYGISFMGKDWDKALPDKKSFQECFRVLKHGGLAFVMSSPRQDVLWRMMALLEGVGFELRQSPIFWTYASGFPKAYDVGKGIDKRDGRRNSDFKELGVYLKQKRLEANLSTIQLGEYFKTSEERINHGGCITNWEKGYNVPTKSQWIILKEKLGLNAEYEFIIERVEAKREIIGKGGTVGDPTNWFKGEKREEYFIDKPETDLAKKWDGWKSITGLKPAVEVVLMVNKPKEGSYVDNVLKHGVGAVNVDACRIPYFSDKDVGITSKKNAGNALINRESLYHGYGDLDPDWQKTEGRFPANLLVSDDVLDSGRIHKSGKIEPHHIITSDKTNEVYGEYARVPAEAHPSYGDKGGFSRFFSLDAWWRERVKLLPVEVQRVFPFLVVSKASRSEKEEGLDSLEAKRFGRSGGARQKVREGKDEYLQSHRIGLNRITRVKNIHPTVKPLKLMSYLVELGCPAGGVVLDPFVGQGTTLVSSFLMGKSCIAVEMDEEYCLIADTKMKYFTKQSTTQKGLFKTDYSFEVASP